MSAVNKTAVKRLIYCGGQHRSQPKDFLAFPYAKALPRWLRYLPGAAVFLLDL